MDGISVFVKMYMDDIKVFEKDEKEPEALIQTMRIYSWDIGMNFGIENVPCW